MNRSIYKTYSFCPECLRELVADVVDCGDHVTMEKACPEHGNVRTVLWEDTAESYLRWMNCGGMETKTLPQTEEELKAFSPYHCQIDPMNRARPTTAALMVTARCNLNCPVCFTRSAGNPDPEPSFDELCGLLDRYRAREGEGAPLEFCGGEPTVRDDLPALAQYARSIGFDYIQLNTNGIRLAEDAAYAKGLKDAGITTVYLGFDGMSDRVYHSKYGVQMLERKKKAVSNAADAGLSIVLVPCIMPGINDGQLGGIIEYAKSNIASVKGVYFQPISYFGKYPPKEREHITIPRVLRLIEAQSGGKLSASSFLPGNAEHPLCSFQGIFLRNAQGELTPVTSIGVKERSIDSYQRVRNNTKYLWGSSNRNYFSIGGMTFQDVWNYDSQRTGACTIQIIGRDGRLVPLCAKYLTSSDGQRISAADI